MLDALRRAAGAPVSYAELREAGIDLPASVVSELELAGVAIERCVGAGRGVVGVRLDPANEPGGRPTPDPAEPRVPTETEPESDVEQRSHTPSLEPRRTRPQRPGLAVTAHPQGQPRRAPPHQAARPGNRGTHGDGDGNERSPRHKEAIPGQPRETCRGPGGGAGRNCARVLGRRDLDRGRWPSSASVNRAATPSTSCGRRQRCSAAQRPQAHAPAAGAGVACPRYRARGPGA